MTLTLMRSRLKGPARSILLAALSALPCQQNALAQWSTSSNDIYNSNSGNVGIGTSSPSNPLNVSSTVDNLARFDCTDSGDCWIRVSSGGVDMYVVAGKSGGDNGYIGTMSGHPLIFRTANTDRVLIDTSGNLGIGTASPSEKLEVNGNVVVSGNISARYQDLAEWVPAGRQIQPGTVVAVDPNLNNSVLPSAVAYDTRVAGVVSAQPGIVLGEAGSDKVKVATTGRVKVRVDATTAPIRTGDLLVTSDREGMAMRSEPMDVGGRKFHQPGTLIGKALEPLAEGEGEILVLLSLQ